MATRLNHALVLVIPVLGVLSGWMAVIASSDRVAPLATVEAPWVRSVDGWERATWLVEKPAPFAPPVHPAAVAGGLLSAAALVLGASHVLGRNVATWNLPPIEVDHNDRL